MVTLKLNWLHINQLDIMVNGNTIRNTLPSYRNSTVTGERFPLGVHEVFVRVSSFDAEAIAVKPLLQ